MATVTYSGGGNTSLWSDPRNWRGGVAPGPHDSVLLAGGADSTVTGPITLNNVMILSSQSVTFTGAVTTYGVGNCQGFMVCVFGTATFAPGSSLNDGGVLQIGFKSTGTFIAQGTPGHATTIQAKRTQIGIEAAGVGFMTIDGATMTDTSGLFVAEVGRGSLVIQGGGRVNADNMTIGRDRGAVGQVSLTGNSILTVDGMSSVGGFSGGVVGGTGTVSVGTGSLFHAVTEVRVATGSSVLMNGGTLSAGDQAGGVNVMAGGTIAGYGTVTTRAGAGFRIDGVLEAKGGVLDIQGGLTGAGALTIDAGCTAIVEGKWLLLPTINFAGAGGTLVLAQGATIPGEIDGFTYGDAIKMAGVATASWSPATHMLTLSSGGRTVDNLHLGGNFAGAKFVVTQQSGIGVITLQHL